MKYLNLQVLFNQALTSDIFSMTIFAPEIAQSIQPGQFAMLYLPNGELLLPRPISICDVEEDTVTFVYQVVGAGTKVLANINSGEQIRTLAPLGKGFLLGESARTPLKKVAVVGGGIGVAPLLLLTKSLALQGASVDVFLGFRDTPVLLREFDALANVHVATETGSEGHKGYVTELLQQAMVNGYDEILTCGPRPMLDAVAAIAKNSGIPCQLSMEERMACGMGTCVGCVLSVEGTYMQICTEGPVFYSDKL